MNMKVAVAGIVLCAVSFGFGMLMRPSAEEPAGEERAAQSNGETEKLRKRVRELESRLAERSRHRNRPSRDEAKESGADETPAASQERPAERRPRRFDPERLAREEPERYAAMTNRMAEFRRNRDEDAASKLELLASVDVSMLDDTGRKTHQRVQELIANMNDLESRMQDPSISQEERRKLGWQLMESGRELMTANDIERRNLISVALQDSGFSDADAAEMAGVIKRIEDVTDSGLGRMRQMFNGMGGRGRGGHRGGGAH